MERNDFVGALPLGVLRFRGSVRGIGIEDSCLGCSLFFQVNTGCEAILTAWKTDVS